MDADFARRAREQADFDSNMRAQELAVDMDEADEAAAMQALQELDELEGLTAYDDAELLHLMELDDEVTASAAIAAFNWAGLAQQPLPAPPLALVIDLTEDDENLDTLAPDTRT